MQNVNEAIIYGIEKKESLVDIFAELGNAIGKVEFYRAVLILIESGKIPNVLICYCGHDCSRCRIFRATLSDDDAERKTIAEFYKTEFKQEIPVERLNCLSSRSDEIMEGCLQCPYMKCSKEKDLHTCSECSQYPCEMLSWYLEKYVNKVNQV